MYCGYSSRPVGERLVGRRLVVAHHAGHEPSDRLDHDQRRDLTAGQHEVADRELAVDQVVARPARRLPRSARRAARSRPSPRAHAPRAWSKRSAAGAEQVERPRADRRPRPRRRAAPASAPSRPRHRTASRRPIDADRSRPSAGRAPGGREGPARGPSPIRLCPSEAFDERREDREDVDPHVRSAFTRTGRRADRRRPGRPRQRHDERGRDQHAAIELEQVARRVRDERRDEAEGVAGHVEHERPDELVHPQRVGIVESAPPRGRRRAAPRPPRGCRHLRSARRRSPAAGASVSTRKLPVRRLEHRAGFDPLEPVRHEVDDDVALQPVRSPDRADLEHVSRRSRRLPRPRRGRPQPA